MKSIATAIRGEIATERTRIDSLETKIDTQGVTLSSILQTQQEILKQLKVIAERPPSFTDSDRQSLSEVINTQAAHTSSIAKMAEDVSITLVHVVPDGNPEGERCAKELADMIIADTNARLPGDPISPYQQPPAEKTNEPVVVEDEDDEDDEDEEEEEEPILLRRKRDDDEDDDDDDSPGAAKQFFSQPRSGSIIPDIFYQTSGDESTQPQGSDPSGKNKQVVAETTQAQSEGEIVAE